MHKIFITAAILGCMTTAAQADDAAQWTGFYAGLSGAFLNADQQNAALREQFSSSITPGIFVGYDRAVSPNVVIGAELAYLGAEVSPELSSGGTYLLSDVISVNARVGYAHRSALFYGGLGYTSSGFNTTAGLPGGTVSGGGLSAFLGVEAFVSDNITVRAEIMQSVLGSGTWDSIGVGDVELTSARLGLAWRF